MNLRRGFFRLWIVASTLFAFVIVAFFFSDVRREFQRANALRYNSAKAGMLPVLCKEARGKGGTDYSSDPWNTYLPEMDKLCWYKEPDFRRHYPEYSDLKNPELSNRLYRRAGLTLSDLPAPWSQVGLVASVAVGPPLALLIIGCAIGWAFAGFKKQNHRES